MPFTWSATGATVDRELVKPYILVCDDNHDMANYLRNLLLPLASVQIVHNGHEALLKARTQPPPGLILSDVMMPIMDGFTLVNHIRNDPSEALRLVPIILLSARAGEEARVEGVERGADDYLAKPFSAKELVARVRTHLELGRLRRELVQLAKLSPVGVVRTDPVGRVVYQNHRMRELSGKERGDSKSNIHPEDLPNVLKVWKESTADKSLPRMEFRFVHDDGRVVWALAQFEPEMDHDGNVMSWVGAVTDISERVAAQKKQLEEAEENQKAQEMFIDMICHEIRNPLNAIYNNTDLLRSGLEKRTAVVLRLKRFYEVTERPPITLEDLELAFEQLAFDKECLDAIESCAAHQKVITDDVLHLSRLRNGTGVVRKTERRRFSVKSVLESVRKMFAAEVERLGVQLEF
ncbi:hypothetical protein HK097_006127, partial [Rhizophlyctis rosea]